MDDLIDRQQAIDALGEEPPVWYDGEDEIAERNQWRRDVNAIKMMPSAQPEEFEWCTDCKEYDQTEHCCHRWTKVIRQTVAEIKAEQPDFDTVAEIDKAHDDGYKQGYLQGKADYEPKTGEWLDFCGSYQCSHCNMTNAYEDNFCPNCGARMKEGEEHETD